MKNTLPRRGNGFFVFGVVLGVCNVAPSEIIDEKHFIERQNGAHRCVEWYIESSPRTFEAAAAGELVSQVCLGLGFVLVSRALDQYLGRA